MSKETVAINYWKNEAIRARKLVKAAVKKNKKLAMKLIRIKRIIEDVK